MKTTLGQKSLLSIPIFILSVGIYFNFTALVIALPILGFFAGFELAKSCPQPTSLGLPLLSIFTVTGFMLPAFTYAYLFPRADISTPPLFYLVFVITVMLTDTAANLYGALWVKKLRRHSRPFALNISPNKTWAGAFAALIVGTLGFPLLLTLFNSFAPLPTSFPQSFTTPFTTPFTYLTGFTLAWISILGDLFYSHLKRKWQVKDYYYSQKRNQYGFPSQKAFLGAHGGLCDRFDGQIFVNYFVILWLIILPDLFRSFSTLDGLIVFFFCSLFSFLLYLKISYFGEKGFDLYLR